MCDHDIYAGGDQPDPNNPNKTPDGKPRTTNGMFATKAAIAFAKKQYPTGKVILHGGSAGSAGVFNVAYSMQKEGVPPAGAIADSGEVNTLWERAQAAQGVCPDPGRDEEALAAISARVHPELAKAGNEPDQLIARGALTVPILHVWSSADPNTCGSTPMTCSLRDGSTKTLGSADCAHEPMRIAVAGAGPEVPQPAALREPGHGSGQLRHARAHDEERHQHGPGRGRGLQRDGPRVGQGAPGRLGLLHNHRDALAHADAHRGQAELRVVAALRARGACVVSRRAPEQPSGWPSAIAPPFGVEPLVLGVDAPLAGHGERLRRERLVQLDQVDVVEAAARALERLLAWRAPGRCP